ncbi:MAG: TIR domain-containing protein [Planctomycetaceae bacterium]|nr:TIR domain-containing protein [Planctomycetaceae bacterium]
MADAPRVFLSYSHDSAEHVDRVLALADALRAGGIDVILDRYVDDPDEGWPRWMAQNIEAARFVLLVCTDTYRRRAMGLEEPGRGLGVDWEGNLIFNAIYHRIQNDQPSGSRFIPILLPGSEPSHIPDPVQGHSYYQLATFDLTDRDYATLYRRLTNQPATPRPDLGPIQILPPIPRPQAVRGTVIDLNGRWDGGSVISVADTSINIDMSASNRPAAHGSIVDSTTITVTFPDDATYTGTLQQPNTIIWSNGTAWTKV